jgi:hypothetical protein
VFYNVLKRDDSGQAGMTSKEGYSTFYEAIIIIEQMKRKRTREHGKTPDNVYSYCRAG